MQPTKVRIVGAGPAGTASAIAALSEGARVHILERSRAARHKVCGEFIPPEAREVLDRLGVWQDFLRLHPGRIQRCRLYFGARCKEWHFSETAWGLSRFQLDRLLLERAVAEGAGVSFGETFHQEPSAIEGSLILANGRKGIARKPGRLFGFKTHFEGPTDDAVELHFTRFGYIGVSVVEDGLTNVCGIASEEVLRRWRFDIDELVRSEPALADRLGPLARKFSWLSVGPLTFSRVGKLAPTERTYAAGDALGFVDPFTGSGILNALMTGTLAGTAAARQSSAQEHLHACKALLGNSFLIAGLLRIFQQAQMSNLALLIPGDWLYRLTRPMVQRNV